MDPETKEFLQQEFKKIENRLDRIEEELGRVRSNLASLEKRIINLEEADASLSLEVHKVLQKVPQFA